MNKLRRIIVILLMVLLLPVFIYTGLRLSSLNDDEKVIRETYQKQLDAILFSINQFADDNLSSWVSEYEAVYRDSAFERLYNFNTAIVGLIRYENKKVDVPIYDEELPSNLKELIQTELDQYDTLEERLIFFQRSGYQRIETLPIEIDSAQNHVIFLFHLKEPAPPGMIGGIIVNTEYFIEDVLGPKLQAIAKEQFIINVGNGEYDLMVFDKEKVNSDSTYAPDLMKELWLLPGYELGISTKGESLQQIIKNRMYVNLGLIIILNIVIIAGIWLIFRNVKRELFLAQAKSDFVSNVSHEIRTPLALISMFAETLSLNRVKDEKKKEEYHQIIHKEALRLTTIVNKILSFSQLDAGKKSFDIQPESLNELVHNIMETYEFHLQQHQFEWEIDDKKQVKVFMDKGAIEEVLINLLDNAVKYSKKNKKIKVTISSNESFGIVHVQDHGAGISKEDIPHIFEKFYRVSSGDLAKEKGTGLGLALCEQILNKHNGKIEVKSELDHGSIFSIYLPIST